MRSTVHEARQGEGREPMRVRWLCRTAHNRRYAYPEQVGAGHRQASWIVPPIALEHEVCMHVGNAHRVKNDPRVAFTRLSNGARECLMGGWDLTRQEMWFAASSRRPKPVGHHRQTRKLVSRINVTSQGEGTRGCLRAVWDGARKEICIPAAWRPQRPWMPRRRPLSTT